MEKDTKLFEEIRDECKQRLDDYQPRDELFKQIYQMSIGEWDRFDNIREKAGHIMPITSPDPANFIDGLVRILTPNKPEVKIPKGQDNQMIVQNADQLEKVADAILVNAGRVRGDPLHFDIMRNACTFSEVHVGMSSTWDLVRDYEKRLREEKDGSKRKTLEINMNRAKRVAEGTPYIIEVFDPRTGYPNWDRFGLESYLRVYKCTVKELLDKFGDTAREALGLTGKKEHKRYEQIEVCDYLDGRWHQIWLRDGDGLILQEEHGLPFIPVVAEIIQGTTQAETPVLQRRPPLYNYWKSGMWQADNLFFTITFSNIFAMLSMPPFMSEQTIQEEVGDPEIDFDAKPPRVDVPFGRKLSQLQMRVVTPDIMTLHDLAQAKGIESTMYRQAMGEPLSGSPSYSLVAFLAQSAKTVLNTIVEKTGWLIADVAKMGLLWMRHDSGTYSVRAGQEKVNLMSSEVPEGDFLVECMIRVQMPQDRLGASQIVAQLASIPGLPVSLEWMVEELLGVEDVSGQKEKKWSEQVSEIEYQKFVQQEMMKEQQMQMAQAQAQQQQMQNAAAASEQQAMESGAMPGMQGEGMVPGTPPEMTGTPEVPPGTPGTLARMGVPAPAPVIPPIPRGGA